MRKRKVIIEGYANPNFYMSWVNVYSGTLVEHPPVFKEKFFHSQKGRLVWEEINERTTMDAKRKR